MEARSFGEKPDNHSRIAIYLRGNNVRVIAVRFSDAKVSDCTMTYADDYQKGEPETRKGWQGLWEFAQAHGD